MTIDNVTHDMLKDLYAADADTARTVLERLHCELKNNAALYEDENGDPTDAGMILFELMETVFVHGLWKRDRAVYPFLKRERGNINANE